MPLPADALQRVLFVAQLVHVYTVPPLASMKGYTAADWTVPDARTGRNRQIFAARLRIVETAVSDTVTADILLEDPDSGTLFAAAPYTDVAAVEHVLDSSRFFVLRVVGEGRRALLGIGFEDRSDAFDFGVALQETRKILGIGGDKPAKNLNAAVPPSSSSSSSSDYSLKPGQTITIKGRRRPAANTTASSNNTKTSAREEEQALFSIPPPPAPGVSSTAAAATTTATTTTSSASGEPQRKRPTSGIISAADKPTLGFEDSATFD